MGDTSTSRRKRFLFVDDDAAFLGILTELFVEMSKGTWEIFTATSHAGMLEQLQKNRVDLVVLDVGMPVMDGVQLLRLLARTHPGMQVVMLTGFVTEENRRASMDNGAVLFLQKPVTPPEFSAIYSALDALAGARGGEGFQGVMQRVGLNEVLQFECLGRRSSNLEVFSGKARGTIHIHEGSIVHAESGALQGEVALYSLLALRGGGFNLLPYEEPVKRTIEGSWEMLLMEAARLSDEAAQAGQPSEPAAPQTPVEIPDAFPIPSIIPEIKPVAAAPSPPPPAPQPVPAAPEPPTPAFHATPAIAAELPPATIAEVLLCSGAGEVLYHWECPTLDKRLALMDQVEQQAARLSNLGPVGRFDRLEVTSAEGRAVCQIQPHRRLFVRSNTTPP